ELPARAGELHQLRGRGEADAELVLVLAQPLDHLGRSQRIRIPEGTAAERRPAEPEDRADVAVARGAEDALAQAMRGLVHHLQHAALGDLAGGRRVALVALRGELVDRAIHLLGLRLAV